jgi:hypothetical protein
VNWRSEIPSLKINWVAGIHVLESGDSTRAYVVLCKRFRSRITKVETNVFETSADAIRYVQKKDVRNVCLTVTGKGIISRQFSSASQDEEEAFHEISGTTESSDFWKHAQQISGGFYLSIARSQRIQPTIDAFKAAGLETVYVAIGFHQPILFQDNLEFYVTDDFTILATGKTEIHLTPVSGDSLIEFLGLTIDNRCAIALAGVIDYMVSGQNSGAHFQEFNIIRTKRIQTQKVNKFAALAVSAVLVVLLVDSIIFNIIWQEYQENQIALEEHQTELSIIQTLKSDVQSKQELFDAFGSRQSALAVLSDRIATSIPPGITLSVMDIHPMEGKVRKGEAPEFNREIILIEGTCVNKVVFNQWANTLDNIEIISNLTILHFSENQTIATFSISLELL